MYVINSGMEPGVKLYKRGFKRSLIYNNGGGTFLNYS